jgi:hypothetical protein
MYDCGIINDLDNFVIIDKSDKVKKTQRIPNNKELRLALDIYKQHYPLYKKSDMFTQRDFIKDLFNYEVTTTKIYGLRPFKKIVKKKVINSNGTISTKLRYRLPF